MDLIDKIMDAQGLKVDDGEEKDENLLEDLIKILKNYIDLKEEQYLLFAIWIIGTYLHPTFYSYPYLFFNAMRGSGKSRTLKLAAALSYKGDVIASLNEAVLFRAEPNTTFCIDEFESIGSKEKQALRELLNASYKKGTKVKRVKEVRKTNPETLKSEKTFEVENFEPYRPIIMANIWGMDEVLNDRCLTLVLEKSNKKEIVNKIEIFDIDEQIIDVKRRLSAFGVVSCQCRCQKDYNNTLLKWNEYIMTQNNNNNITTYNNTTQHTLFSKIRDSEISSRALELCFPLIMVAEIFGKEIELIVTLKDMVLEKQEEEFFESRDVQLFDFVSQQEATKGEYILLTRVVSEFRIFMESNHEELDWLNNKWMGKALKRLALTSKKRRVGHGREVILNVDKAKEKMEIFKK